MGAPPRSGTSAWCTAILPRIGRADGDGEADGFVDFIADFIVSGATVVGVGVGAVPAYGVPWLPFLAVLSAYYSNDAANVRVLLHRRTHLTASG